jgi:hypothetical protein
MTNEDIIRMAREALKEDDGEDYYAYTHQIIHWWGKEDEIVKFAQLIAAAERNQTWTQNHWTEYERSIVATEREACAALCDKIADDDGFEGGYAAYCADMIRARGKHD